MIRTVLISVLLLSSCGREAPGPVLEYDISFGSEVPVDTLMPSLVLTDLDDSVFVGAVSSITYAEEVGYFLVLTSEKRIIWLSEDLRDYKRFGTTGEGPGELSRPQYTVFDDDSLFVFDDKVEVFDSSFTYMRTIQFPSVRSRPAYRQGLFFVGSTSDSTALLVVDDAGQIVRGVRRRRGLGSDGNMMLDDKMLLRFGYDRMVGVYQARPRIELYAADGEPVADGVVRDGGPVRRLIEQVGEKNEDFRRKGMRGYRSNMFVDVASSGSYLFLLCAGFKGRGDGSYVLVFEEDDGQFFPIRVLVLLGPNAKSSLVISLAVDAQSMLHTMQEVVGCYSMTCRMARRTQSDRHTLSQCRWFDPVPYNRVTEMIIRLPIVLLVVVSISGCLQEAEPMQTAPQDMSKAVFYHYGQPDGVSKNAVFGDAPESGLRSAARKAEPIVQLELTNKISEAGLEVHADGSVTKAPWQPAYTRIQEGLADLPVEAADLPQYVIDQMVVQKMVHYTDLLDDTLASDERIALSREFLDVLVANNYPDPTIVARLLESVGSSLDVEESRRVASKALAAQRRYRSELQPMADECPECLANKVKGYTPDARTRYDESVRKLEAIEAASN